jgi:hypothetical protein
MIAYFLPTFSAVQVCLHLCVLIRQKKESLHQVRGGYLRLTTMISSVCLADWMGVELVAVHTFPDPPVLLVL